MRDAEVDVGDRFAPVDTRGQIDVGSQVVVAAGSVPQIQRAVRTHNRIFVEVTEAVVVACWLYRRPERQIGRHEARPELRELRAYAGAVVLGQVPVLLVVPEYAG